MKYPWQLYHWHFEISAKCAVRCPVCPRQTHPNTPWMNKEISLKHFKNILSPDLLSSTVKRITMCGDIGDPIYCKEYLEIIEYVKSINPKIHVFTITNGSFKTTEWWEKFADLSNEYDSINFSVDGYDNNTNNLYRINTNWESIMDGMRIMTKSDAFVNWATIVFNFNEDHLDKIKELAADIGCDGLQITRSTKWGDGLEPSYEGKSSSYRYERELIKLTDRVLDNKEYLELNEAQLASVQEQYSQFITPLCLVGNRGLYVNAAGTLFPCSWTSFPYDQLGTERKTIKWQDSFFEKYRDELNVIDKPLTEVLNSPLWEKLFSSWNSEEKAWVECEQKCPTCLVKGKYAVGYETN